MKHLNNKGFISVEILIASILATSIAIFLIDITMRMAEKTDDAYVDTILMTDKAIIMNNIRTDIDKYGLRMVEYRDNNDHSLGITFNFADNTSKDLYVTDEGTKLVYKWRDTTKTDNYEKKFDIHFDDIAYSFSNGEYASIKLSLKTIFSDDDYGFIMTVPCQGEEKILTISLYDVYNEKIVSEPLEYKFQGERRNFSLGIHDIVRSNSMTEEYYFLDDMKNGNCEKNNVTYKTSWDTVSFDVANFDNCELKVCPTNKKDDDKCKNLNI